MHGRRDQAVARRRTPPGKTPEARPRGADRRGAAGAHPAHRRCGERTKRPRYGPGTFAGVRRSALPGSGASTADICRIKGAGPAKAACIKAALELANRVQGAAAGKQRTIHLSPAGFRALPLHLPGPAQGVFPGAPSRRQEPGHPRGAGFRKVPSTRASSTPARSSARRCASRRPPSSSSTTIPPAIPRRAREDIEITRRLREAGDLMGIKVLDHIIIGDGVFLSFVAQGMM